MQVGDKFSSYEEFNRELTAYKESVNNEFWIRDARTIENQRKRAPESVENINESLKYYHMRLACVKGGRPFKPKNENTKRKCMTFKEECAATIFVRVSACKQYLCVLELKENHTHTTSKIDFTTLSQQRLQLQESVEDCARESEKKNVQECDNMIKNSYKCSDIQLLVDDDDVFKGLYFQDEEMKKYFEAFPEMLFTGESEDADWTERFIRVIQSKPAIYDSSLPEHHDRKLVSLLWNEVYEIMTSNWQNMTSKEKSETGKELQKKWKNLRKCFRRELKTQREISSGQAAKKRRKYLYYDQLLFLLPTLNSKDRQLVNESNSLSTQEENSESEEDSQIMKTTDELQDDSSSNESRTEAFSEQPNKNNTSKRKYSQAEAETIPPYEQALLNILKERKEEVIDEDKFFLLSLVPAFKKLDDVKKFEAKIDFLATLKRLQEFSSEDRR